MAPAILLRGGTVLSHDENDHVSTLLQTDILIEHDLIKAIGKNIEAPQDAEVVDCAGKIISPGFINTHHHLWETQPKGCFADHTLLQYMASGNMSSYCYTPEDIFWGQLTGCLESLNAGTTTILDHNHASYTAEHATRALSASAASGIRIIFAYQTYFIRLAEWTKSTIQMQQDFLPEWPMQQLESWCTKTKTNPIASGRVQLGFAFDFFFLGPEAVSTIYTRMRSLSPTLKVITSHVGKTATMGTSLSVVDLLSSINHLHTSPNIHQVFSHVNNLTSAEYAAMSSANIAISTTPSTEYQMSFTNPLAFHPTTAYPHLSLGVDCHAATPTSSMPVQARTTLLVARALHAQSVYSAHNGAEPKSLIGNTREAFNLITIAGARALGMEKEIGSIAVGKKADLVVFDSKSPNMVCADMNDAVVAVVVHSDTADVESVMVDGVWRKKAGKLYQVKGRMDVFDEGEEEKVWEWSQVAERVRESWMGIRERLEKVSFEKGRELITNAWGVDEKMFV